MSNQPISKGFMKVAVDRYETTDQVSGQKVFKNRYATIGRYTEWPDDQGNGSQFSFEIETLPIAAQAGPLKGFFDPDNSQAQGQTQHQDHHQQGGQVQSSPYANNPQGYAGGYPQS